MKRHRVGGSIKCNKCNKVFKTQGGYNQHKCKTSNPGVGIGKWMKVEAIRILPGGKGVQIKRKKK